MLSLLWFLIIGAVAGWLAGQFTKGSGFGLGGNLAVGIIGALLTSSMLLLILYFLKASSLLVLPTLALGIMTFRLRVPEEAKLSLVQASTASGPVGAL